MKQAASAKWRFCTAAIAVCAIAAGDVPSALAAPTSRADPHALILGELGAPAGRALLDRDIEPLAVEALAEIRRRFGTAAFRVNQPYQAGQINVYFVDGGALANVPEGSSLLAARSNFIAVQPDIILIDSNFAYLLIGNAVGEIGSELEAKFHAAGGTPFDAGARRRSMNGAHLLRIGNLQRLLGGEEMAELRQVTKDYERLAGYRSNDEFRLHELAQPTQYLNNLIYLLMVDELFGRDGPAAGYRFQSSLVEISVGVLAFILLHELGHLSPDLAPMKGRTTADEAERRRDPEAYADRIAAARIREYLAGTGSRDFAVEGGVRTTAFTLVDMLATQLFEGFRDLDGQKTGFFIDYAKGGDCGESIRGFFDFNLIADISPTMLPIPTQAELNELLARGQALLGTTHQSNVVRSGALIEAANMRPSRAPVLVDERVARGRTYRADVFEALLRENVGALRGLYASYFRSEVSAATRGIPSGPLVAAARADGFEGQPAALCPAAACTVLTDAETGNVIEVVMGEGETLLYMRMMSPGILPLDPAQWPAILSGTQSSIPTRRFTQVALPHRLLSDVLRLDRAERDAVSRYYQDLIRCGFASFSIEKPEGLFRGSTLGNGNEVQLEFIARRQGLASRGRG